MSQVKTLEQAQRRVGAYRHELGVARDEFDILIDQLASAQTSSSFYRDIEDCKVRCRDAYERIVKFQADFQSPDQK